MWKILIIILIYTSGIFAQSDFIGKKEITINENGVLKKKIILNPLLNSNAVKIFQPASTSVPVNPFNNTTIRWSYGEPTAIGDYCQVSGNGKYCVVGWNLNSERVSLYGNSNSNPVWEFSSSPDVFINYTCISDTGGVIGVGSFYNIYLFNNTTNVPFFNYDISSDPDTATALDITKDGKFIVSSISRLDTSIIFAFNSGSTTPVWGQKIIPSIATGGAFIQGVRISGNDSLVIINTYAEVFVFNTFTGQLRFKGLVNPGSPTNGTQATQGINGDGSIIATINYSGLVTAYQWNGSTYNMLWVNQEPPGMFYNWYTSVDITYDGNYIAAGTLNFVSASSFNGKVKVFKRTGTGTPQWTYSNCGDEVTNVSFSKSGNILSASSYGDFNGSTEDLYIFKTFSGNVPIFKVATPGSFFYCNTSNDGRTVVASGKAVHARQFGNGGLLYNIDVDTNDVPSSVSESATSAEDFKLYQNFPNPFNPKTVISYQLAVSSFVSLKIYDILGNEVSPLVNKKQNAGFYKVEFDGSHLSSGLYFYKLVAGNFSDTKKLILIK